MLSKFLSIPDKKKPTANGEAAALLPVGTLLIQAFLVLENFCSENAENFDSGPGI